MTFPKGVKLDFFKWVTVDEKGFMNGVSEDAPEGMKEQYEDYVKKKKELNRMIVNGFLSDEKHSK